MDEPISISGPVEEGKGLEERDSMADCTTFLDNATNDEGGDGGEMGGGDLGEFKR